MCKTFRNRQLVFTQKNLDRWKTLVQNTKQKSWKCYWSHLNEKGELNNKIKRLKLFFRGAPALYLQHSSKMSSPVIFFDSEFKKMRKNKLVKSQLLFPMPIYSLFRQLSVSTKVQINIFCGSSAKTKTETPTFVVFTSLNSFFLKTNAKKWIKMLRYTSFSVVTGEKNTKICKAAASNFVPSDSRVCSTTWTEANNPISFALLEKQKEVKCYFTTK